MKTRLLPTIALFALAAVSQPRTFVMPHILEKSGRLLGVVWDVEGGQRSFLQPGVRTFDGLRMGFSPEGSMEILDTVLDDIKSKEDVYVWKIKRATNNTGDTMLVKSKGFSELRLPPMDASSKDTGFFETMLDCDDRTHVAPSSLTKAEKDAVKTQKKWLTSNFRFRLGDLPCRINQIDSIVIADVDRDGELDIVGNDVVLVMDQNEASRMRMFLPDGTPVRSRMELTLTNNAGAKMFSIIAEVQPVGYGIFDVFEEPYAVGASQVQVKLRVHGHVTVLK